MHFLLIPYALVSLIFVLHYQARDAVASRGFLIFLSIATGLMVFVVMLQRPADGDSWTYYQRFLELRALSRHSGMQRESGHLAHRTTERLIAGRQRLQGEHLAALLRTDGNPIRDRVAP